MQFQESHYDKEFGDLSTLMFSADSYYEVEYYFKASYNYKDQYIHLLYPSSDVLAKSNRLSQTLHNLFDGLNSYQIN